MSRTELELPAPPAPLDIMFHHLIAAGTDISEHLETLRLLASRCRTPDAGGVVELGVRTGVSTIALAAGRPSRLRSADIVTPPNVEEIGAYCLTGGVRWEFTQSDSRLAFGGMLREMTFIDTLHEGALLERELEIHAPFTSRWIVLHDTTTFGDRGEQGGEGLWPVVERFLERERFWSLLRRYTNNNGLTILERI